MIKKESMENMKELLNQAIEKNSKAEILKISQMLDHYIKEFRNSKYSSKNVKAEKI